nr:MAG TPA: hypothetical protein [Bacteriophage sp.]DAR48761.1 MAG TPA: hypothetical protein [Bacteriophage sp.]
MIRKLLNLIYEAKEGILCRKSTNEYRYIFRTDMIK